ncbi:MAG: hypothetical protein JSS81_25135 [Acidobacteria bacterium]|nr:hypothetical protein [Acidobacteriota bacterium]
MNKEEFNVFKDKQKLGELLNLNPDLNIREFVAEADFPVEKIWKRVVSYNMPLQAVIDAGASETEIRQWRENCLTGSGLGKELLLSIGGYGGLPWLKAVPSEPVGSIISLLELLPDKELLIYDPAGKKILYFFEEENFFGFLTTDPKSDEHPTGLDYFNAEK